MSGQVQVPREGMFSDIEDDVDLLATFNAFRDAPKECCIDVHGHEVVTNDVLKYLLKKQYDANYKEKLHLPQYVKLSPFVSDLHDTELVNSIINTDSWDVFKKKLPEETNEYENRLDSLMVENRFYSNGSFAVNKKSGAKGFVRQDYLRLLFHLPKDIIRVDPVIRAPPIQPVDSLMQQVEPPMQPVEPPMQPVEPPISVSISPPPPRSAAPRPAPLGHDEKISVSIGGDRHKRAQIKAKSSKKRAQKKSSKKRINKNKNKRRTRSRKALK